MILKKLQCSFVVFILICIGSINLVATSDNISQKQFAIKQPAIPQGFKEIPFIEEAPAPLLTAQEKQRGYMLFSRPVMDTVYPNTLPLPYERLNVLTAFAAQGEIEPLTFSIYPVRKLKNFRVKVSNLKSSSSKIKNSAIDIRLLTYWNIRYPMYNSHSTYRRMPELLEKVSSHTSPAYECQRWWLTVRVPDNAQPGIYSGNVTIQDDVNPQAVSIPIKFRVLDFKLLSDPNKYYSAFYHMKNSLQYGDKNSREIRKMLDNEYRAMRDIGMNMFPTMRLGWDKNKQKLFMEHADEIDILKRNGFTGPLAVSARAMIASLYRKFIPGGTIGAHWVINKMPPPEFYKEIERAVRLFIKENKDKKWPKLYCKPIDEVSVKSKEFGAKVYQAFKNAGMKTFISKNPVDDDAAIYSPYVDAWCAQPYSVSYENIVKKCSQKHWCYPNHNGTEIREPITMCKGGRMTYGYGFWRSGYNTIMPWHWSWGGHWDKKYAKLFDYLRSPRSGSGQRIGKNGEIIFAVNWMCFREGVDDNRYIYTLEQAIWARANSKEPKCLKLITDATAVLQKLWDDINVQEKYLHYGMWPSTEFNARRWQLASYISALLKYPVTRKGSAPSVIVNTTTRKNVKQKSLLEGEIERGNLEVHDLSLSFNRWKSYDPEGEVNVEKSAGYNGKKGMHWNINVDHHGGQDKYHIGWPKIRCIYNPPLDFTKYDYLRYMIKFDSDRNEVADDVTILGFTIQQNSFFEIRKDMGGEQRVWLSVLFNIHDIIKTVARNSKTWLKINMLQLFIPESKYKDKTRISFDIGAVELLRFKTPVISKIISPEVVLLPQKEIPVHFEVMGNTDNGKKFVIIAKLLNKQGTTVSSVSGSINVNSTIILPFRESIPGQYQVVLKLMADNYLCSTISKPLRLLAGPFFKNEKSPSK